MPKFKPNTGFKMKGSSFYGKMKSTGSPLNQKKDPMALEGETKEETRARLMAELDKQHDRENWEAPKYKSSDELKEGDYMTYKTDMYRGDGSPVEDITEEQTSQLQTDKKGRLYATNLDNPSDTIYVKKPVVKTPKKGKK